MVAKKALGLAMIALLAGLVLAGAGIAVAAPAEGAPAAEGQGFGMRMGEAIRDAGARAIDIVVDLTGLEFDEIHDRRTDGESMAAIAASEGVDTETLVAEMLDARAVVLSEKVADGSVTQDHADQILANMEDRITERVNSTELGKPGGRGNGQSMGYGAGQGRGAGEGRGMGGNGGDCVLDAE